MKLLTYRIIKYKELEQQQNKPRIKEQYLVLYRLNPVIENTMFSTIFFMMLAIVIMIISGLDNELIKDYYIFSVSTSVILIIINTFTATKVAENLGSEEEAKEYIKEYKKLRG